MRTNIQPDKEKAKALKKMADVTLERLNETPIEKYPTNTLNDFYDILHKLLEAYTLSRGVKFKGEGAHKELVDYGARELSLEEEKRIFLQQMREYRNKISYEGFIIHSNYIKLNRDKINTIIKELDEALLKVL